MSCDKPKVVQNFEFVIDPEDRDKDGKLTAETKNFLGNAFVGACHRIVPHVPVGRSIRIKIEMEGDLA